MGQSGRAKDDVQDAAAAVTAGFRGGVQDQRAHRQYAAPVHRAGDNGSGLAPGLGLLRGQASRPVRAGDELERAVVLAAGIEVHAQGHQLRQQVGGRLDEQAVFLVRPAAQVGMVDPGRDRDAEVLVDGDQPVALDRLFEIGALDGDVGGGDDGCDLRMRAQAPGQRAALGLRQQATRAGRVLGQATGQRGDVVAFLGRQDLRDDGESVGVEAFFQHGAK